MSTIAGKLDHRTSVAIQQSLKNNKQGRMWESLVGYSLDELKQRLEKQFQPGMSWERFMAGEIHIDHIIPISAFNYLNPEDVNFQRCWSLEDLQPLWAKENRIKHNTIEKPFQPCLTFNIGRRANCVRV